MADKMLDRISKLLNQSDRAPEGSPEREAFKEKAQTLASAHSIDLAIARSHQAKKERVEEPEERRFKIGDFSGGKVNSNSKWLVELFLKVARVNDVKSVISHSNIYVWGHGFPFDLDVTEKLYTVLAAQMVAEADAALKRGDHKREVPQKRLRYVPGTDTIMRDHDGNALWDEVMVKMSMTDGRVWRANFYQGFIDRIHGRLWNAKRQAQKDAGVEVEGSSNTGLVLRDKALAVQNFYEETTKHLVLGTRQEPETSRPDYSAQHRGGKSAERADIGLTDGVAANKRAGIGG